MDKVESVLSSENKRIQEFCSVNMALVFIPLVCRACGMISSVVKHSFGMETPTATVDEAPAPRRRSQDQNT
jgi:hypothetical protein